MRRLNSDAGIWVIRNRRFKYGYLPPAQIPGNEMKYMILLGLLVSAQTFADHEQSQHLYDKEGKLTGDVVVTNMDNGQYAKHLVEDGQVVKYERCDHRDSKHPCITVYDKKAQE